MATAGHIQERLHERFFRYRRETRDGVELGTGPESLDADFELEPRELASPGATAAWLRCVRDAAGTEVSAVLTDVSRASRIKNDARDRGPIAYTRVWALALDIPLPDLRPHLELMWSGCGETGPGAGFADAESLAALVHGVSEARPIEAYRGGVVLGPLAAATVVHECIGHLAEATTPATSLRLGARLASELLNVDDDPQAPRGVARYQHDAANIQYMGPTQVVRGGRLLSHLHTPTTASAFDTLPTPNARTASAWDPPLARMSNLRVLPGDATDDELLDALGRGLYVHRLRNGLNNGRYVEAEIVLAERVASGALTGDRMSGGWLRLEPLALRHVAGVGRHARRHPNALCGKHGQLLFDVGTRSPALHLSRATVEI